MASGGSDVQSASGRTAVITGVTSGIGAKLATRLVARGWQVVGLGRSAERLQAAAAAGGFTPVVADLAHPAEIARAIDSIGRQHDRVDALVNNAAECVYETPTGLDDETWRRLFDTNVLGAIQLTSGLRTRLCGGHVVNVSSVVTRFLPAARFGPYAVSKAALDEWTRALRLELAPQGTAVTLIAPGLVDTPIYDKVAGFATMLGKLREQVPAWLSADDVAEAVTWTLERPAHVTVTEMTLLPRGQAR